MSFPEEIGRGFFVFRDFVFVQSLALHYHERIGETGPAVRAPTSSHCSTKPSMRNVSFLCYL